MSRENPFLNAATHRPVKSLFLVDMARVKVDFGFAVDDGRRESKVSGICLF